MRRKTWLIALAFCLALPAGAGDWLVGGSAGTANVEVGSDFDEDDTGYKLFGGWRMFRFFGLEGGYVDMGAPEASSGGVDVSTEVSAWDAFAMGVVPLGRFEVFGKAGLVMWDADATVETAGISVSESDDGTDLAYGIGAAFKCTDRVAIRGEWELFDVDEADVYLATIGIDVRF